MSKRKLGLVAGAGSLPLELIRLSQEMDIELYIVAIEGEAQPKDIPSNVKHIFISVTKIGSGVDFFRKNHVQDLILVGKVNKPNIATVKLDFTTLKLAARVLSSPNRGDSEIYSQIIKMLEEKHFKVVGIDDMFPQMVAKEGVLGSVQPTEKELNDIQIGLKAARINGELDVGQGVMVEYGTILSIEGQENTDNMIKRSKELKNSNKQAGLLVKVKKPIQDHRIDLPAIGTHTVQNIYDSGFRGIAIEAGGTIIINPQDTLSLADELGIFIIGIK